MVKTAVIACFKIIYTMILKKEAKKYVQSTDNEYDDKALKFLSDFVDTL